MRHRINRGAFNCPVRALALSFFISLIALSFASPAQASFINLSGELEVSYSWSRDTQGSKLIKELSDFQQRYNLRNYGELWDPKIGTFTLSGTFLNQEIQTRGDTVSGQENFNNLRLLDYGGSVSLMPRSAPLTFSVQQLTQYNGAGSCYFFCSGTNTRKDRTTNYNVNWLIPLDHLPTIRINLNEMDLRSNNGLFSNLPTDITTRFANVEVSQRFKDINVMLRYQFAQTNSEAKPTTNSNAINLNVDGRLTDALSVTASGRYTNQGGVNTSQVSFVQERGGNIALYYRPSHFWDGSLSYDLSQSPGGVVDFSRQIAQGSLNLHPTMNVDLFGNYRFMRFDSVVATDSQFGTGGFNWRNIGGIFGLLTGASFTYGETDVDGGTNTKYMNGTYRINYTKGFDQYRLNTGYNVSYGVSRTTPTSPTPIPPSTTTPNPTHKDLLNSANVSIENTNVRILHWFISYSFTDTHRDGDEVQSQDDQRAHVAQVNVDSNFFKNLLLQASASYTNIEGFGTQGGTIELDGRASYFMWQGLSLMAEVNHKDFPHGYFGDSDTFTGEVQWMNTVWQRLSLLLDLKDIYQLNESTTDRQIFQGNAQLTYQLGKLLLSLSYLYIRDEGIDTADPLNSQNFFVRAIRSF